MGRGRAKAKQVKVARQLGVGIDQRDSGGHDAFADGDRYGSDDDADDDLYDEDDEDEDDPRAS
jgi:hypothetical protein